MTEEEESTDTEPEVEAKATADELETSFDEKEAELSEQMDEIETDYTSVTIRTANLATASSRAATAGTRLAALLDIVDSIDTRRDEVNTEMEDESISDDQLSTLSDESGKFDELVPKVKAAYFRLDNRVTEFQGNVEIEKDRRAATGAAEAELITLRGHWATAALAKGHFTKHKGDTGLNTEVEYLTRAKELTDKSAGGDILKKTRTDGDYVYYDKSNGNFAIKSAGGKIRTLFNPSGGESYYNKQ